MFILTLLSIFFNININDNYCHCVTHFFNIASTTAKLNSIKMMNIIKLNSIKMLLSNLLYTNPVLSSLLPQFQDLLVPSVSLGRVSSSAVTSHDPCRGRGVLRLDVELSVHILVLGERTELLPVLRLVRPNGQKLRRLLDWRLHNVNTKQKQLYRQSL